MSTQTRTPGITFAVQQVERATKPLPTCQAHESLNRLLDRPIEACCGYTPNCLQKVTFHPLLAAAHFAFSEHQPLVLSPDMIWIAIVQGLAQHGWLVTLVPYLKNHRTGNFTLRNPLLDDPDEQVSSGGRLDVLEPAR